MTVDITEIAARARGQRLVDPELRWGQAVFNAAYELYPAEADQLRGGPLDPFYTDGLTELFLDALTQTPI